MAGPPFVRFQTTVWSVIRQAGVGDRGALNSLAEVYREPVVGFVRRGGAAEADAEDVAQEVLLRITREPFLRRADRARGKFRSLILAVTRHVLADLRRREGVRRRAQTELSDGADAEGDAFDRLWFHSLIGRSLRRLREESAEEGRPYYEAVRLWWEEELSYAELARRLGVSAAAATNYLHRGKGRLRRHVLRIVEGYVSSTEEFREESECLMRYLKE